MRTLPLSALFAVAALAACSSSSGPKASEPEPLRDSQATVTAQELDKTIDPVEALIRKRVPGLQVLRTDDGGVALQIRGAAQFYGKAESPLYVLDGSPYEPGPGGALTGINPYDIQTIKVLRGPEAAIYGIQGQNGVIVITTKRSGTPKR